MLGRRRDRAGRILDSDTPRIDEQLRDLIADNTLPASQVGHLTRAIRNVAPGTLPTLPAFRQGATTTASFRANAFRSFSRAFLRGSRWPKPYWAQIRCHHVRSGIETPTWLAFGLPHEYVNALCRHGDMETIMERSGCDPNTLAHVRRAEVAAGVDLLPLGLWGDGAPCQWDRADSIEAVSLNLPGQCDEYKQLRLPLVNFPKKHTSAHTWPDIFEVLSWSFRALASGQPPSHRHDGSPWDASDNWRMRGHPSRAQAPPIRQRAALCEVRADWVFHTAVFHLPAHNRAAGNCWLCDHTPGEVPRRSMSQSLSICMYYMGRIIRRRRVGPPADPCADTPEKEGRYPCEYACVYTCAYAWHVHL